MPEEIKDVSEEIKGLFPYFSETLDARPIIRAEQKGKNVLVMVKLETPFIRADGKTANYRLEHRWLSNPNDLTAVQGSEFTYWRDSEWNKSKKLFDQFQLF